MRRRKFITLLSSSAVSGLVYAGADKVDRRAVKIYVSPEKNVLNDVISKINDSPPTSMEVIEIHLANGNYINKSTISLNLRNNIKLRLIGNVREPTKVRILSEGKFDLFYCDSPHSPVLIDGFSAIHLDSSCRGEAAAFLADNGGRLICGPNIYTNNFYYGVQSRHNSVVLANGIKVVGAGDAGLFAFSGGYIQAKGALSAAAEDKKSVLGSGFVAEYGGVIDCLGARAIGHFRNGFSALSNGTIRAYNTYAAYNHVGFHSSAGGVIVAHDAISEFNRICNWHVMANGVIERNNVQMFGTSGVNERSKLCFN